MKDARRRIVEDALFYLVLTPERLSIEETTRAASTLEDHGVRIGGLIVNRILPPVDEGPFMAARLEQQEIYLKEISERFEALNRLAVLQSDRDVSDRRGLEPISERLTSWLDH